MRIEACFLFHRIIYFLLVSMPFVVDAQESQDLDSLLKKADLVFMEKPQEGIRIAEEILKKSTIYPEIQISSLLFLSYSHSLLEEYSIAIDYALQAKSIAEKHKDEDNLVVVLTELGNLYHLLKINQKANMYFDEAETLIAKNPLEKSLHYIKGNIFTMKGNAYMEDLNNKDLAISYYNKAIHIYKNSEIVDKSIINLKLAYLNKGFSFTELNNQDSAMLAFQQALGLKVSNHDDFLKLGMAQVLLQKKELVKAKELLKECTDEMDEFHKNLLLPTIYKSYSQIYLEENNFEMHRYYYHLYKNNSPKIEELEKKSFQKIIDQISIQGNRNRENEMEKFWMIIAPIALLFLIFLTYFSLKIWKKYKQFQNSNQIILKHLMK